MKMRKKLLEYRRKLIALWLMGLLAIMAFLPFEPHEASGDLYHYITTNFIEQTQALNGVTAIYLDYRMFDTLFETLLLLVSVIGIIYFSRHEGDY